MFRNLKSCDYEVDCVCFKRLRDRLFFFLRVLVVVRCVTGDDTVELGGAVKYEKRDGVWIGRLQSKR